MKIYPSKHGIKEVNKIKLRDIPLSYLDTSDTAQYIEIIKEPFFNNRFSETIVKAYEEFNSPEIYLFDKNNAIVKNIIPKRLGDRYIYEPQNAVEFTPQFFSFSVLIKKCMSFKNDQQYNLKIAVHEEGQDLAFSKKLISVFGDAPRRGLCPVNITVNDQSMIPESLINSSIKNNDFIFLKSEDGIHIKENNEILRLDIDTILDDNVNVWLAVESFESVLKSHDENKFIIKSPVTYSKTEYILKDYGYYFDANENHSMYPKGRYTYISLFDKYNAALVIEKANSGFVVITHKSFFDNLHENVKLLYEIMMKIFLQSYYRTKEFSSWITNQPVDYIAFKNSKYNLQHTEINLNNLLKNNDYNIGNEYNLLNVDISTDNAIFINMNSKKDMFFYKIGTNNDPVKNSEDISLYTSKHSVIHYKQEVIKRIESGLNIDTEITETGLYITVHPCRSTKYHINTTKSKTLRIDDVKQAYVLCCKEGSVDIENDFVLIPSDNFTEQDGLKVAVIKVNSNPTQKIFDIRVNGGGLPIDSEPDYNMLDIGHINGRPYRLGSTLIIKLPSRLKEHDEKIQKALIKHSSSGDYLITAYK